MYSWCKIHTQFRVIEICTWYIYNSIWDVKTFYLPLHLKKSINQSRKCLIGWHFDVLNKPGLRKEENVTAVCFPYPQLRKCPVAHSDLYHSRRLLANIHGVLLFLIFYCVLKKVCSVFFFKCVLFLGMCCYFCSNLSKNWQFPCKYLRVSILNQMCDNLL